jgi:hypothetical protein
MLYAPSSSDPREYSLSCHGLMLRVIEATHGSNKIFCVFMVSYKISHLRSFPRTRSQREREYSLGSMLLPLSAPYKIFFELRRLLLTQPIRATSRSARHSPAMSIPSPWSASPPPLFDRVEAQNSITPLPTNISYFVLHCRHDAEFRRAPSLLRGVFIFAQAGSLQALHTEKK